MDYREFAFDFNELYQQLAHSALIFPPDVKSYKTIDIRLTWTVALFYVVTETNDVKPESRSFIYLVFYKSLISWNFHVVWSIFLFYFTSQFCMEHNDTFVFLINGERGMTIQLKIFVLLSQSCKKYEVGCWVMHFCVIFRGV